jgi:hypothetical protein
MPAGDTPGGARPSRSTRSRSACPTDARSR